MAYLEKAVLDWWLLARSQRTLTLGVSAFSFTAIWFRDAAGSPSALHLAAHNVSRLTARGPGWIAACDAPPPAPAAPPPQEGSGPQPRRRHV